MSQKMSLVLLVFLLIACGSESLFTPNTPTPAPLTSISFEPVCEKQSPVENTPAYEQTPDTIHPFIMFARGNHDFADSYSNVFASSLTYIPDTWINEFTKDDLATTELVVCVDQTNLKKAETCEGYADDENPEEEFTLELYDVTYEITLYSANTAEVIDSTAIVATSGDCPSFAMFDDPVETRYAQPFESDELKAFLEAYVDPTGE